MRIEGKRNLTHSDSFGLFLKADHPLSEEQLTDLEQLTGARVFSLSHLFRLDTQTWEEVYRRFKKSLQQLTQGENTVFAYDLAEDSPLHLFSRLFIRIWLKAMLRKQRTLIPALLITDDTGDILNLAKALDPGMVKNIFGRDKLRRYLLTKLLFMDSALDVQRFYQSNDTAEEQKPIVEPIAPAGIISEIIALPEDQKLCQQGEFQVWIAHAPQIPYALQEIGRLREVTFRSVGEGTGNSQDLDEYDLYYDQLIIWDSHSQQIVGGYRIGRGDNIYSRYGVQGFYIHSLFNIKEGFFPILPQALELGRSYIIQEYQRKRLPLFLLWKGILHLLIRNPQYRFLYGPVSISNHYSELSRSLIVYFVRKHFFNQKLSKFLKPRKRFKYAVDKRSLSLLTKEFEGDLDKLNSLIEDIEPSHIRMPVLLRQYIRQNARFIAFNLDPNFSDALDGFILLDLKDIPKETLEALNQENIPGGE